MVGAPPCNHQSSRAVALTLDTPGYRSQKDCCGHTFVQAIAQLPFNSHNNFRPGKQFLADLDARWEATNKLALLLQLNAHWKGRDSGTEAEPEDSGGRTVSVSPGLTYAITPRFQAYAFVQLPVYQRLNGVQLVADRSYAAGISWQF